MAAVSEGRADLAAIDAVTWALVEDAAAVGYRTHQLRVIGMAPILCPALPYVINSGASPSEIAAVQEALRKALAGCPSTLISHAYYLSISMQHPKMRPSCLLQTTA